MQDERHRGQDKPAGLQTRDRLVISAQELCDDLLEAVPTLHAAMKSRPATNSQLWRRTDNHNSRANVETFELVGHLPPSQDGTEVQYAVAASMKLHCHPNEVLNVLVCQGSAEYDSTMRALEGRGYRGGDVLYHEHCRLIGAHEDADEEEEVNEALLGVRLATLPSRKALHPLRLCGQSAQTLGFCTLTHRYPGTTRAVHVMKTLPKHIHDLVVPRNAHSVLNNEVDHLGMGVAIDAVQTGAKDKDQLLTQIFMHGYIASHTPANHSSEERQARGPPKVNPEARHILHLLTRQLSAFERVIARRRFGFQSFIYSPPAVETPDHGRPVLADVCVICLQRFRVLWRRQFFCQICGHSVCRDCSRFYDVEARVSEVRQNRVCVRCVVRVDACVFADEDIVAALGPVVVPMHSRAEWLLAFQSHVDPGINLDADLDGVFGSEPENDADTASICSDSSFSSSLSDYDSARRRICRRMSSQEDPEHVSPLLQLENAMLSSRAADTRLLPRARRRTASRSRSGTAESTTTIHSSSSGIREAVPDAEAVTERVRLEVERYVNRSLLDAQNQFPMCTLEIADMVRDYVFEFDASKTAYMGHPLPPTPDPEPEARRLHHIQASAVLEPEYDHSALDLVARVAAERMNCPIGFVSLVDETTFHSVVYVDKPLVIKNAQSDLRFAQMRVVRDHGIRFYAGFPIRAPDGAIVGSLCASDRVAHKHITIADYAAMQTLASLAAQLLAPKDRVLSIPRHPRTRAAASSGRHGGPRSRSRSQHRDRRGSGSGGLLPRARQEVKDGTISTFQVTAVDD